MKTLKRRWLGSVIIAAALISWVLLQSTVYRGRILDSRSDSEQSLSFKVTAESTGLPASVRFSLAGLVGVGLIMVVMRGRNEGVGREF